MNLGGVRWGRPGSRDRADAVARAREANLTYDDVGATLDPAWASRGGAVERTAAVGHGTADLRTARTALETWVPQRALGAEVLPGLQLPGPGTTLVLLLPWGPVHVLAPVRVVAVVDEPDRFGYAYGTLPGHPESGEESFTVELLRSGTVRACIRVGARPATAAGRLAGPLVGAVQAFALRRYLGAVARYVAGSRGRG